MTMMVMMVMRQKGGGVHMQRMDVWEMRVVVVMMEMAMMALASDGNSGCGDSKFAVARAVCRMMNLNDIFDRGSMSGLSMMVMAWSMFGGKGNPAHGCSVVQREDMFLGQKLRTLNPTGVDGYEVVVRDGDMRWMK
jgi:hypothetical protein